MVEENPTSQRPLFRFNRRLKASAIFLLLLASLWLTWAYLANRQLQIQIVAIRARNEPLSRQDFDGPPLPKDKNAATYIDAALGAIAPGVNPPSNANSSDVQYADYPPFPSFWHQMTQNAVVANQQALAFIRQSRKYDQADWNLPRGLTSRQFMNRLIQARPLANILADAALLAHEQGDDAEAIERILDLWHLSDMLPERANFISRFVALGIEEIANSRLQIMAPDLAVEGDSIGSQGRRSLRPVRRDVIRQIIAQHIDDAGLHQRWRQSASERRMELNEEMQWLHDRATLLRPMINIDTARGLAAWRVGLEALDQQTWAEAKPLIHQPPTSPSLQWAPLTPSGLFLSPASYGHSVPPEWTVIEQYARMEFQGADDRHVVAVTLAICLYRADHHDWPPNLKALVPAYLPRLPVASFSEPPAAFGYTIQSIPSPGSGPRPLLFFNGMESSTRTLPPPEPQYGPNAGFQWRDLARWAPPPTTQPTINGP